ncbi:MAG: D-cysteine desulfhydrase [Candidatus Limnocylindria bacterium]
MHLARFPRRRYTIGPTSMEPMDRLSGLLGGPRLFIKHDDMLGLAGGGNKARKLEFLMADALAGGATSIITCGAVQSNHCRMTAAAAAREGLECHLVLEERVPGSYRPDAGGNNFLFHLLGVASITVVPAGTAVDRVMEDLRASHAARGTRSYVIPGGGSNALGALGYVACADEILAQAFDQGIRFDAVVCASGSGGTHAGLLAGLVPRGGPPVIGISVRFETGVQVERVQRLADQALDLLGSTVRVPAEAVTVHDGYVGDGYSLPTQGMVEAVRLMATTEGILLDPVYTGKAMAGLIDLVRTGGLAPASNVLFVHTGGAPALFAYQETFGGAAGGEA